MFSEILTKVNNAKDKPKKIAVLKQHENVPLKQVLKGAFDPSIIWDLPEGDPPYNSVTTPIGTEHGLLRNEAKRLWHFVKGADNDLTKTQKETMFIQILEGLHQDEIKVLLGMKSKSLNKMYKGLTESVVKEAFGWNDKFYACGTRTKIEQKHKNQVKKARKKKTRALDLVYSSTINIEKGYYEKVDF